MIWRLLVMLSCLFNDVAFAVDEQEITLAVAEETLVTLPSIAVAIDLSKAGIVVVSKGATKAQLYIQGRQPGKVTMLVEMSGNKKRRYLITVGDQLSQVKNKLAKIPGIKISEQRGKILISGQVDYKRDLVELQRIKGKYPGLIIDAADKTLTSGNTVVRTINRILAENDLANLQAHAYGKIVVLEGSPKDPAQAELGLRIARLIYPGIESRLDAKSKGGPSIAIEVLFVEVKSDNEKTVGIKHGFGTASPDEMKTSPVQSTMSPRTGHFGSGKSSLNWQIGGLSSFLQLIQTKSNSRVLSNPKLVARTGEQAKFHAGKTSYLTRDQVQDGQVIREYYPVDSGIQLQITPTIDAIGQIDAKIKTVVSEFDIKDAQAAQLSKSEVETAVTIREGQTIMLSGLVRKQNAKAVERVPILADIPLVGELFKSRQTNDSETEMLVLVTMTRVRGHNEKVKAAGHRLWQQAGDDVRFSLHD